jgi:hypothetical protein
MRSALAAWAMEPSHPFQRRAMSAEGMATLEAMQSPPRAGNKLILQPPASLLRKVRKVNGSECTRGSQNAGRNASKIRELFQRRLANDWAKNGYFQYSVTRTVCEVLGTPRAVAIMGGHDSGR